MGTTMRKRAHFLGLLMAVVLAAACESAGRRLPTAQDTNVPEIAWPQPPQRPRIRFVRAVARPRDLGIQPTFWQRVGKFIIGKGEESFVRPTGVAAQGPVVYVADPGAQALWVLDTEAGRLRTIRDADGQRLVSPVAVATGRNNHVFVADSFLAKVFRYDTEGNLTVTIASPNLRSPAGVAYDSDRDRLYVADSAAHRVWVFEGSGAPAGEIGRRGIGDGEFNFPTHVTVDRAGTLCVTDALNFRLQMFNSDHSFAGQFGQHGDSSGEFAMPKGVAVDSDGHVYVAEALFDAVQVFDRQGRYLLSFGERGLGPGQFWLPNGLFIDARDRVYVADAYNQRIQIFEYLSGGGDE
jgi:DNA-binding beta-propeller fold protein YncE